MKKTALLFPGQGSQKVGMAADIYREYEIVRELFDMAEEITKTNISSLCFNGPIEKLTETINLQPAITVVNLSWYSILKKEGFEFDITAGHSLGEYCALTAAGVIPPETAFRLIHMRATLMHREALKEEGAMSAVINIPVDRLREIIRENEDDSRNVCLANHNAESQIVISGIPAAVKRIGKLVKASGGMAIPLKVSGAWHSHMMKGAEEPFREFISDIVFSKPSAKLIFNVSADYADDTEAIKENMVRQLCNPVRWFESVQKMAAEEITDYVEAGPGNVLAGLVKKTVPKENGFRLFNINSIKNLEFFLKDDI